MTRAGWLLPSLFLLACGGSVSDDGGGSAAGGSGNAGSGGSAGSSGGNAGSGGSGNLGGSGGDAPFCCKSAGDCPQLGGEEQKSMSCVNGNCKPPPPLDRCWQNSDCPFGQCTGAGVCPCGDPTIDCIADQLGWCMSPAPPPSPACCVIDMDCGDEQYVPCVNGVCKQVVADGCWKDAECPLGEKCIGASVCPCDALCALPDYPGKCG